MKMAAHLRVDPLQLAQPLLAPQLANLPPSLPVVLTTWTTIFRFKPLSVVHRHNAAMTPIDLLNVLRG
jgi:hypothetical protein